MKLITAIIKPFKFYAVRESLSLLGVQGIILMGVKECGHSRRCSEIYRGAEYVRLYLPKFALEVAVNDEILERVVKAIAGAAMTGQISDGNIFVAPLEHVVRTRTGQTVGTLCKHSTGMDFALSVSTDRAGIAHLGL
jgi:nitrogen regulatory protein P-II 2